MKINDPRLYLDSSILTKVFLKDNFKYSARFTKKREASNLADFRNQRGIKGNGE